MQEEVNHLVVYHVLALVCNSSDPTRMKKNKGQSLIKALKEAYVEKFSIMYIFTNCFNTTTESWHTHSAAQRNAVLIH